MSAPQSSAQGTGGARAAASRAGAWLSKAIRENLFLKLVALAVAIGAWSLVQNRPTAEEYATIMLEYEWPEDLVLDGEPVTQVLIRARGPRTYLRELARRELRYVVDLRDAAVGETTLNLTGIPVENFPPNLEITTISPSSLTFVFDERVTRALPVQVQTRGEVAFGMAVAEIVVDPDVVSLSGARPDLESMEFVPTRTLDLSGRDKDFAEILGLDLGTRRIRPENDGEVSVLVRLEPIIETRQMEVPVELPEGLAGATAEPAEVTVVLRGPARELHRIRTTAVQVYVEPGDLSFRGGKAQVSYGAAGVSGDAPMLRVRAESLPATIQVTEVIPTHISVVRGGR